MKNKPCLTLLVCVVCSIINISAQEIDYNCNIDTDNYTFIDSLIPANNLINERDWYRYSRDHKSNYTLITTKEKYQELKPFGANDIDFEQYNIFAGFFTNYGLCPYEHSLPFEISLMIDNETKREVISIIHNVFVPYLKINCPPHFIVVKIPKRCSSNICYTQKFIENEN